MAGWVCLCLLPKKPHLRVHSTLPAMAGWHGFPTRDVGLILCLLPLGVKKIGMPNIKGYLKSFQVAFYSSCEAYFMASKFCLQSQSSASANTASGLPILLIIKPHSSLCRGCSVASCESSMPAFI